MKKTTKTTKALELEIAGLADMTAEQVEATNGGATARAGSYTVPGAPAAPTAPKVQFGYFGGGGIVSFRPFIQVPGPRGPITIFV